MKTGYAAISSENKAQWEEWYVMLSSRMVKCKNTMLGEVRLLTSFAYGWHTSPNSQTYMVWYGNEVTVFKYSPLLLSWAGIILKASVWLCTYWCTPYLLIFHDNIIERFYMKEERTITYLIVMEYRLFSNWWERKDLHSIKNPTITRYQEHFRWDTEKGFQLHEKFSQTQGESRLALKNHEQSPEE